MNKSSTSTSSSMSKQDGIVDQAKQTVSHVAENVAGTAREQVNHQFDAGKDKAVETMGTVASAIRETSDKLKGVGPLGDVAGRAADGIDSVAQFFENKHIADVARDVERFARREPALFLGAAFALGLIGGRFLKSSAPRSSDGDAAYARAGGGFGYDRESFGRNYGDYLADDEFEYAEESRRYGSFGARGIQTPQATQATGRSTLPLGSRDGAATKPKTEGASSSFGASATFGSAGSTTSPSTTTSSATAPSTPAPANGISNGTAGTAAKNGTGNSGSV